MFPQDYEFETLHEHNQPSEFSCGVPDLDEFICTEAVNRQDAMTSSTLLVKKDGECVAFCSLCTDTIPVQSKKKDAIIDEGGGRLRSYPALKIGMMAVATDYQDNKIGKHLVSYAVAVAGVFQKYAGIRFVTVDAFHKSVDFYKRLYFEPNGAIKRKHEIIPMYLDLREFLPPE